MSDGTERRPAVAAQLADDITKFEIHDDVYYVLRRENGPELYRRVGESVLPRVMAAHDGVLIDSSFREVVYDGMLFGVYHPFGGKMGHLTARDTDERAVVLDRVKAESRMVEYRGESA